MAACLVMKRPLIQLTLVYVAGIIFAEFCRVPLGSLLIGSLVVAGAALLFSRWRQFFLWPLVFATGLANNSFHIAVISPFDTRVEFGDKPEIVTLQGQLHATPKEKLFVWDDKETWRTVARLDVTSYRKKGEWIPVHGSVLVTTPERLSPAFFKGRIVEVCGVIAPPRAALAEGLFDYRRFLEQQGIYYQLKASSPKDWNVVDTGRTIPLSDRFNAWAKKVLAYGLPEDETTHLLWTLVLDWKSMFTDEAEEPFMRAGTYHIFAVDGLRIAIVSGILVGLFRLFQVPRALCGLVVIPLIWFYTGVTDWPASAIRASIMMTVVIGSWALKRPPDLVNSLFAAALIILLWQPQQLFQAGFQLSFFVVLCIALLMPVLDHVKKWVLKTDPLLPDDLRPGWRKRLDVPLRYMLDMLVSSWAAWIGSIPLAAYYFHLFTPVSTPANIVVVPLTFLTLISCLVSMLLWWCPPLLVVFNHSSWFLMKSITWLSQWTAEWRGGSCYVESPSGFSIVVFYIFLLALHTRWFWKSKHKLAFACVLGVIGVAWCGYKLHQSTMTRIHVLPLNGGHAIFVDSPHAEERVLIDCGNEQAVEFIVKPFLRAHGVNQLSKFVLTHGDIRYIGGADLISRTFYPKEFVVSSARARSPSYRQFIDSQKEAGRNLRTLSAGERCGLWTILHPAINDEFSQADDNAIVLKGTFGNTGLLLCSDLGRAGQHSVVGRTNDFAADILVTGLPRQDEPVSNEFLLIAKPKNLIIADAESPATERASAKLRQRLSKQAFTAIYCRESGSVVIECDRDSCEVKTIR